MKSDWSFSEIWNDSLISYGERPTMPRDYIYASELGKPFIDRYLKMMGTKPSNPPTPRSLRKFQAGNIFEGVIHYVLLRSGILKKKQVRSEVTIPGCLRVSGKLDFLAGGEIDWDKVQADIDTFDFFPDFIKFANQKIIARLQEQYAGVDFIYKILEVKSLSDRMFNAIERVNKPIYTHKLQDFHYLWGARTEAGETIENGTIIYVSREDCQLLEFNILSSDQELLEEYTTDIATISGHVINRELPPKCPEVIFDERYGKFNLNIDVEYSYYLTKLYKYNSPTEFHERWKPTIAQYNRVLKRCANGDTMTLANKTVIQEAKKIFPRWDEYVEFVKKLGDDTEE